MSHKKKTEPKQSDPDSWVSWKFPQVADMDWREQQEFIISDLGMSWGAACSALKKCWKGFYASNRRGEIDKANDYAERILAIQRAMGIQESDFGIF